MTSALTIFISAGFTLLLLTMFIFLTLDNREINRIITRNNEVLSNQPDEPFNPLAAYPVDEIKEHMTAEPDPETTRAETLQKVYDHFDYEIRGIPFSDYVRKADEGTHGELAGIW